MWGARLSSEGLLVEYIIIALAAIGVFAIAIMVNGVRRALRQARWERDLDAVRTGTVALSGMRGIELSRGEKAELLRAIAPRPIDAYAIAGEDENAFGLALMSLERLSVPGIDSIGRLAQDRSSELQRAGDLNNSALWTAAVMAVGAERLRRTAPDEMGAMIANGNRATALMFIWPKADE